MVSGHGSGPDEPAAFERVRAGLHIVVDGHLNPLLLVPSWFKREGLMREEEVRAALESLDSDASFVAFRTGDLSFVASLTSVEVFSNNEGFEPVLRDLFLNIFTLLRHTPLNTLTIGRSAHLLGQRTTLREADWAQVSPLKKFHPLLGRTEIVELTVKSIGGPVPEGAETVISLQPSHLDNATLFIECRYSFDLTPADDEGTSSEVLTHLLKSAMESTLDHSDRAQALLGTALLLPAADEGGPIGS